MKKIIVFSMFIIFLLFVSSNIDSQVDKNIAITDDIDVLYVEKEIYDVVKSMFDKAYDGIEYGIYIMDEEVINFYVSNDVDYDQLNIDKEIIINNINDYNNEKAVDKYLNLYVTGSKIDIVDFYDQFDNYLIETNNTMGLDSRLTSLENNFI